MSQVRIGNAESLAGSVDMPLVGVWVAEVELGTGEALPAVGDRVRLEVLAADGPGVAYSGTVRDAGEHEGRAQLFIVGGAGGLGRTVAARPYANGETAYNLFADVLRDAGEAMAASVDAAALRAASVQTWLRAEGTGATALQRIGEHFGLHWRVLADGTVWMGAEAWPAYSGSDPYELSQDRAASAGLYADAETLAPGYAREGRKFYRVQHTWTSDGTRARVTFDRSERDDFREAVRGAIPELLYLVPWEARVVGQNGDGTLEVIAYDPRIGGLSKVPIRYGVPGSVWTVPFGARVFVGFAEGDPSKAYAGPWWQASQSGLTAWALTYSGKVTVNGGGYPVARKFHQVDSGDVLITLVAAPSPPAPAGSQIFTITYTDEKGGGPFVWSMLLPPGTSAITPPGGELPFPLIGQIVDGYAGWEFP